MYRMTLSASHAVLRVRGVADICTRQALGMAAQAGIQDLFRRQAGERDDGRLAPMRRHVVFAGTMTALAACVGRLFLS